MSRVVVLDPELLVRAALTPEAREVVEAWRNGQIRPALTRRMLAHALGLLREIGLSNSLLERWALWLSDSQKVFLLEDGIKDQSILAEYVEAARRASATILSDRPADFDAVPHEGVSVERFG